MFGAPRTGAHSYRILDIAIVDTVLTVLLALLTAWATRTGIWQNLLFWFIAGEIAHWAFGTQTAVLTKLGIHARTCL